MANDSHLKALRDPMAFKAQFGDRTKTIDVDLAGAALNADCSGLHFGSSSNFSDSVLRGSTFRSCRFANVNFQNSDWADCDFLNASFDNCNLSSVRNAHRAKNLYTTLATDSTRSFESIHRPWWNKLDWELLGTMGRLPLFTASTVALIFLPLYFYFLDIYNQHLVARKKALATRPASSEFSDIMSTALTNLQPLPIPKMSLLEFIAAVLLLFGSVLYWRCPPRVRQFNRIQWCEQMNRPLVVYWASAWMFPVTRILCALSFSFGGVLAILIIGNKVATILLYISLNSEFTWHG
jgi:pentapeptide repeat protein